MSWGSSCGGVASLKRGSAGDHRLVAGRGELKIDESNKKNRQEWSIKQKGVTKGILDHIGTLDEVETIAAVDFSMLKGSFKEVQSTVARKECMNPVCAKFPEKSQEFLRCSGCHIIRYWWSLLSPSPH